MVIEHTQKNFHVFQTHRNKTVLRILEPTPLFLSSFLQNRFLTGEEVIVRCECTSTTIYYTVAFHSEFHTDTEELFSAFEWKIWI